MAVNHAEALEYAWMMFGVHIKLMKEQTYKSGRIIAGSNASDWGFLIRFLDPESGLCEGCSRVFAPVIKRHGKRVCASCRQRLRVYWQ